MSLIDKIFKKKKRSDELARRNAPPKKFTGSPDSAKKELTLAELEQAEKKEATVAKAKRTDTKEAYRILIKPLVTEKGTYLHAANKYLFEVAPSANKVMIKQAIWHLYGVRPLRINIIKVSGKNVKYGRSHGRTKNKTKAIVTLKSGETIQIYEGV